MKDGRTYQIERDTGFENFEKVREADKSISL